MTYSLSWGKLKTCPTIRPSHQLPRLAILVRQQAVGFLVVGDALVLAIPGKVAAAQESDLGQQRRRRGAMAHGHGAVGRLSAFDAIEKVSGVVGRVGPPLLALGSHSNLRRPRLLGVFFAL